MSETESLNPQKDNDNKNAEKDLQSLFDEELKAGNKDITQNEERKNKLNKRRRRSKKHQELLAQGLIDDNLAVSVSSSQPKGKIQHLRSGKTTPPKPKTAAKAKPLKFPGEQKKDNEISANSKDKKSTSTIENVKKPNKFPVLDLTPGKFPCRQNIEGMNFTTPPPQACKENVYFSPASDDELLAECHFLQAKSTNTKQMFESKFDSLLPYELEMPGQDDDEGLLHPVSDKPLGSSVFHSLNEPYIISEVGAVKTNAKKAEKPDETSGIETQKTKAVGNNVDKKSDVLPVKAPKGKQAAAKKKETESKSLPAAAAILDENTGIETLETEGSCNEVALSGKAQKAKKKKNKGKTPSSAAVVPNGTSGSETKNIKATCSDVKNPETPPVVGQKAKKKKNKGKSSSKQTEARSPKPMKIEFIMLKPAARVTHVQVVNGKSEIHMFIEYPPESDAEFYEIDTNQYKFEMEINFYVATRAAVQLRVEGPPFASEVVYDHNKIQSFAELKEKRTEKRVRALIQTNPVQGTELKARIKIKSGSNLNEFIVLNHTSVQSETATNQVVKIDADKATIWLEKPKESELPEDLPAPPTPSPPPVEADEKDLKTSSIDEKLAVIMGEPKLTALEADLLKEKGQIIAKMSKFGMSSLINPIVEEPALPSTPAEEKQEDFVESIQQAALTETLSPTAITAKVLKATVIKDGKRRVNNVLVGAIPPGPIAKLIMDKQDSEERQDFIEALKKGAKHILEAEAPIPTAESPEKPSDMDPPSNETGKAESSKFEIRPSPFISDKDLIQALHQARFTRFGRTTTIRPGQAAEAELKTEPTKAAKEELNLNLSNRILAHLAPHLIKTTPGPTADAIIPPPSTSPNAPQEVTKIPEIDNDPPQIHPKSEAANPPLPLTSQASFEQSSEEDSSSAAPLTEDNLSLFSSFSQETEFAEAEETGEEFPVHETLSQYFDAISELAQLLPVERDSDEEDSSPDSSMSEYFDAHSELSENSEYETEPLQETPLENTNTGPEKRFQYFEVSSDSSEGEETEAPKNLKSSNLSPTATITPRASVVSSNILPPPHSAELSPTSTPLSKSPSVFRNVAAASCPAAASQVALNCESVANQTISKNTSVLNSTFYPKDDEIKDDDAEAEDEDEDSCDSDKTLVNSEND